MTGDDFLSLGVTSILKHMEATNVIKFKVHRMECTFLFCLMVKFLILFLYFLYIHCNLKLPYFIIIIIIWDYLNMMSKLNLILPIIIYKLAIIRHFHQIRHLLYAYNIFHANNKPK